MVIRRIVLIAFAIGLLVWMAMPRDIAGESDCKDAPVKLIACPKNRDDSNCQLVGRFPTMFNCEFYKPFGDAICESTSDPDKMVCEKDAKSSVEWRCRY